MLQHTIRACCLSDDIIPIDSSPLILNYHCDSQVYNALLHEISRRRQTWKTLYASLSSAHNLYTSYYTTETTQRERFMQQFGLNLPPIFLKLLPSLKEKPPAFVPLFAKPSNAATNSNNTTDNTASNGSNGAGSHTGVSTNSVSSDPQLAVHMEAGMVFMSTMVFVCIKVLFVYAVRWSSCMECALDV